jgi:hypothetical protein
MPLTEKGEKIFSSMEKTYGSPEKAKRVFYASRNAGKIKGVDVPHRAGGGGLLDDAPVADRSDVVPLPTWKSGSVPASGAVVPTPWRNPGVSSSQIHDLMSPKPNIRRGYAGGGLAGLENMFGPSNYSQLGTPQGWESLFGRGAEGVAGGLGALFQRGGQNASLGAPGGGGGGINMPFGSGRPGSYPVASPMAPSDPMQLPTSPVNHTAPSPSSVPAGPTSMSAKSFQQFAAGGGAQMPWFARNEARSMLHTGPIKSPVAGRTDHIPLKVPGGSYVLPADHISHLGENNTDAGMARASHMFGATGPFGTNLPKVVHGRGAPSAPPVPRPPVLSRSLSHTTTSVFHYGGGADGNWQGGVPDGGDPVDIMASGGEFVVPPEIVKEIGNGNLDHGHKILDRWVLQERKKHINTLSKLPEPAK